MAASPFEGFDSAAWYDRSINWEARLGRELPVFQEVFGPPGDGGILDAGCGTGHQATGLARAGYTVTGADAAEAMLEIARAQAGEAGAEVPFVCCRYDRLAELFDSRFDGLYCIGNSLAMTGTAAEAETAVRNFAGVLRPGGRMFVQVTNFAGMRREDPCVRGPRVVTADGVEYVSSRCFEFVDDPDVGPQGRCRVINVTHWKDGQWRQQCHAGTLYPIARDELLGWCAAVGLGVIETLGGYDRAAFDEERSLDLIVIAEKS